MTNSPETRRVDAVALLASLYTALCDSAIDCTVFDSEDPAFASFQRTSWDELVVEGLLARFDTARFFLTAKGWSEGLFRSGDHKKTEFGKRVGLLSKALKDRVKGRRNSILVSLDEVVQDCGLPAGWVFNAIDSHLICRMYGRRDAGWMDAMRGRMVEIPRDFNMIEIDLFADVRADNLKLSETIEQMEELYSEFRCSLCGAPLISRGTWEHEYGSEEFANMRAA